MIALGSDHTALEMKQAIKDLLDEMGLAYKDFGTDTAESCDYPIYGYRVGKAVASGECERGITICGTGIGIGMAAGKVDGVRVCCCSDVYTAKLSKQHNDSNVLSLGARVLGTEHAKLIARTWLEETFEGGRHQRRIDQLAAIERGELE